MKDTDMLVAHMLHLHRGNAKAAIAWLIGALDSSERKRVAASHALYCEPLPNLVERLEDDMKTRKALEATK